MMARFYLKTTCAGPQGSFQGEREYAVPGEVPEDLARALVAAHCGHWVEAPAEPEPEVETAEAEPAPENAAERTEAPKPRKRRAKRSGG